MEVKKATGQVAFFCALFSVAHAYLTNWRISLDLIRQLIFYAIGHTQTFALPPGREGVIKITGFSAAAPGPDSSA